jgi:hypothetical protein
MAEIPVVSGMRILTVDQIRALSNANFGKYRRKAYDTRRAVHKYGRGDEIRAFDYLVSALYDDRARRATELIHLHLNKKLTTEEWYEALRQI